MDWRNSVSVNWNEAMAYECIFAEYRRCMVNISYTLGNISLEVENVSVELTQNLLKDTTFLPY